MRIRFSLALVPLLLTAACSSAPAKKPPVIDDLEFPKTATASDGHYRLEGAIGYHDDDEGVTSVKIRIGATGQVLTLAVDAAPKVERLPLVIELVTQTKGDIDYDVSVVSASGVESATLRETVTLQ